MKTDMRIAIAVLAAAALIVFIMASLAGNHTSTTAAVQDDSEHVVVEKQVRIAPTALMRAGAPVAVQNGPARPFVQTQIARTGKISLFVGNIEQATREATVVARSQGGDVFSSEITPSAAQMQIRVPAARFDGAMTGAGQIGRLQEHSTSAQDLGDDITDASARLRNLRRTESDILSIMDRSGSIAQVMDAENQLSDVREKIETLEAELKAMQHRVVYSTISLSMQIEVARPPADRPLVSSLLIAFNNAVHSATALILSTLAALVWVLVYTPLIGAAVAAVYGVRSALRRYQRARSMA